MVYSSPTHRREKTESFEGSQMLFEFPNNSSSESNEVRSGQIPATFSEISSSYSETHVNFKSLTRVSVASQASGGETLSTAELDRQYKARSMPVDGSELDSFHDLKSRVSGSYYSTSQWSVKVKPHSLAKSSTVSIHYSPSQRTLEQFVTRSPSVRQFRTSPSMVRSNNNKNLSKQSTLKRSNAIRSKEGWMTRLVKKMLRLKARVLRWRLVVQKRAFKRRNGLARSPTVSTLTRSQSSLTRSKTTLSLARSTSVLRPDRALPRANYSHLNSYLTREQLTVNISKLSIQEEPQLRVASVQTPAQTLLAPAQTHSATSSYPTPDVDIPLFEPSLQNQSEIDQGQLERELMYQQWSHYLKKAVLNRIELKLELNNYKDHRNHVPTELLNKRKSVLESIITDYETVDSEEEDFSDGFESDTNNGHESSLTSISSYDESDMDLTEMSQEEVQQEQQEQFPHRQLSMASSYYPTRQNTVIKRNNSIKVSRMLSEEDELDRLQSIHSETNLTYIEDIVNIKSGVGSTRSSYYQVGQNPYLGRKSGLTRSPSFVIPRSNTLVSVQE